VQIRTTARQPGLRVRQEVIPSRYKAKQAGLDRTLLTAYTGPHNCHAWCALIGSLSLAPLAEYLEAEQAKVRAKTYLSESRSRS